MQFADFLFDPGNNLHPVRPGIPNLVRNPEQVLLAELDDGWL